MSKRYQISNGHVELKTTGLTQKLFGPSKRKSALFKKIACCVALAISITACGGDHHEKKISKSENLSHRITGYVGSIAADEPQAAMLAKDILIRGGNAADAATALGMALTVTLPSRASLGGGGACLAYRPGKPAQSILFMPKPGSKPSNDSDRPAAIPMMARGLYLLQANFGKSDINDILHLVSNLAGNGVPVSESLASDLVAVQQPLFEDASIRRIFTNSNGLPLKAGDILYQPRLKIIYDRLISAGIADLYIGSLARSYALGSQVAGGGLYHEEFRNALPVQTAALSLIQEQTVTYFLSPPADGGLGMAMAMRGGQQNKGDIAQGTVARWRTEKGLFYTKSSIMDMTKEAQNWLDDGKAGSGNLPALPASTSFTIVDRDGGAVSCALTMNNLFGTGRIAGTTGIIMAASPRQLPTPLLTGAISTFKQRFVASVAASGQNDASQAAAVTLSSFLNIQGHNQQDDVSLKHLNASKGRVNAVYCADGLPGNDKQCHAYTDPNGMGLAISR